MAAHRRGDPYGVGFAKPPFDTRWKPGQSGNPNGRPKGKTDLYAELQSVLLTRIAIGGEGSERSMTIQEALVRKARQMALDGSLAMQKIVLQLESAAPVRDERRDPYAEALDVYRLELFTNRVYETETGDLALEHEVEAIANIEAGDEND